jgi:hypothetical protein
VVAIREDWRDLPSEARRIGLEQFIARDRALGVTLPRAPVWRLAVFEYGETGFGFVFTSPQAMMDARSVVLVLEEVFLFYEAFRARQTVELPAPPAFGEFVEWLEARDHSGDEAYWRDVFKGFNGPATLLIPGPSTPTIGRGEVETQLPAELVEKLRGLVSKHRLTLNLVVKAAWSILLCRLSETSDVVFGEVRTGHRASVAHVGPIAGLFNNTVPVRIPMTPEMTVLGLLHRLREAQRAVREHERSAHVDIQRWCEIPAGSSLFETLLIFDTADVAARLKRKGGLWKNRKLSQRGIAATKKGIRRAPRTARYARMPMCFPAVFTRRNMGHDDDPLVDIGGFMRVQGRA